MDSKFPTEDYERLLNAAEAADAEAERAARDGLAIRVRLEAKKIREKYICPPETVDFGVLYLPSDGLFAEVARIPNLIDEIRAREKMIVLGPTLLPAHAADDPSGAYHAGFGEAGRRDREAAGGDAR